ncbi:hypothetical protein A3Q56_02830 [Intoshia linei]|uniref:F-box domain-containing protein n=1 Tax=Intoshia linei TaxID=1819745 RepID=A0A177B5N5_9BILA|nr:hypothetical protein A3Q56_02830 [Intoshia linei]
MEKLTIHQEHCQNCIELNCYYTNRCPLVNCTNFCGMKYHKCKENDHHYVCIYEYTPCLNQQYGCPFKMKRLYISKHLNICPANLIVCTMEWNRRSTISMKKESNIFNKYNYNVIDNKNMLSVIYRNIKLHNTFNKFYTTHSHISENFRKKIINLNELIKNNACNKPKTKMKVTNNINIDNGDDEGIVTKNKNASYNISKLTESMQKIVAKNEIEIDLQFLKHDQSTLNQISNLKSNDINKYCDKINKYLPALPIPMEKFIKVNKGHTYNEINSWYMENIIKLMAHSSYIPWFSNRGNEFTKFYNVVPSLKPIEYRNVYEITMLDRPNPYLLSTTVHYLSKSQVKPSNICTFLCNKVYRRDEIQQHLKLYHLDMHTQADGWLIARCPMACYGCKFSLQRFKPFNEYSMVGYDEYFNMPIIKYDYPYNSIVNKSNLFLDQLDLQILTNILNKLDTISLMNLSLVSKKLNNAANYLKLERGMVTFKWIKNIFNTKVKDEITQDIEDNTSKYRRSRWTKTGYVILCLGYKKINELRKINNMKQKKFTIYTPEYGVTLCERIYKHCLINSTDKICIIGDCDFVQELAVKISSTYTIMTRMDLVEINGLQKKSTISNISLYDVPKFLKYIKNKGKYRLQYDLIIVMSIDINIKCSEKLNIKNLIHYALEYMSTDGNMLCITRPNDINTLIPTMISMFGKLSDIICDNKNYKKNMNSESIINAFNEYVLYQYGIETIPFNISKEKYYNICLNQYDHNTTLNSLENHIYNVEINRIKSTCMQYLNENQKIKITDTLLFLTIKKKNIVETQKQTIYTTRENSNITKKKKKNFVTFYYQ